MWNMKNTTRKKVFIIEYTYYLCTTIHKSICIILHEKTMHHTLVKLGYL